MTLLNIIILLWVRYLINLTSEENSTCQLTISYKQIYLFFYNFRYKIIVETYIEDINYIIFS